MKIESKHNDRCRIQDARSKDQLRDPSACVLFARHMHVMELNYTFVFYIRFGPSPFYMILMTHL